MTENVVQLTETYIQEEGYVVSDMNGDKVMMSIQSGKYYNLGKTGGRIWELLTEGNTISNIVHALTTEFTISADQCEKHVHSFMQQLYAEGLIKLQES
ncbi:lasso peptide biosynthesis PqqD family chaperone [Paenibacillus sp. Marseille-Q4541]|uniref:lasso peptide biosynthesis PqqD family chaperone n=1 Tax=Paenibacillus sp. Marseille-Q4541 TaxID=2831522 RepID=UPI001BA662D9|nr:lasso peptide biosynthesis PqqD family chaperone [Paenibacillus sp. Marseille-Q4541]